MEAAQIVSAVVGVCVAILGGLGTVAVAALGVWVKVKPILTEIRAASAVSAHELQHNSGTSMKDSLRRIEERQESQSQDLERIEAVQRRHGEDIRQLRHETVEAFGDVRDQLNGDRQEARLTRERVHSVESVIASANSPKEI